jgi:hypothetical protein
MKIEVSKNALQKKTAQSVGVKKDIQARGFRLSFFKANWPDHHV